MKKNFTDNRKKLINQASLDVESGHHLIYPRTREQRSILNQIFIILHKVHYGNKLTVKQKRMYHEYRMNADWDYYNKHKSEEIKN